MSDVNLQDVRQGFNDANAAAGQVSALTGAGAGLEQQLREALTERMKNNPVTAARDSAAGTLLNSGADSRAYLADLVKTTPLSPTQQQQITSARQTSAITPLFSLMDMVGNLTGGFNTAVNAGLTGFQSLLGAAQGKANNARQGAQDLLSLFTTQQQSRQADTQNKISLADLSLKKIQADQAQQALDLKKSLLDAANGGGKGLNNLTADKINQLEVSGVIDSSTAKALRDRLDSANGYKLALGKAGDITTFLEGAGKNNLNVSGTLPALKQKFFSGLPQNSLLGSFLAPSSASNTLNAFISDFNTRLKDIAGKSVTGTEAGLYSGLILKPSDDEQVMQQKVAAAQTLLLKQFAQNDPQGAMSYINGL